MSSSSKKNRITELGAQAVAYGGGIAGRQLINYLALPLFTYRMTPLELGKVFLALSILGFVNTLSNAGLPAALFRHYFDSSCEQDKKEVVGTTLVLILFLAVTCGSALAATGIFFAPSFLEELQDPKFYLLIGFLLVTESMVSYFYMLLRLQFRPIITSLSNVLIIIVQIGFALYFVYALEMKSFGYLLGMFLGSCVGLVWLSYNNRSFVTFACTFKKAKELMAYGAPILPGAISIWAMNMADKLVVASVLGLQSLAIYEVGKRIAALVGLFVAPFRSAWPAFAFSVIGKSDTAGTYRDVLTAIYGMSLFLALFVYLFQSEILNLLAPEEYYPALEIIGWLLCGQVFYACYPVLSIGPKISKKTYHLSIIAVPVACFALLVSILLVSRYGLTGVAVGVLCGYALLSIGTYLIGQASFEFDIDWIRARKITLLTVAVVLAYLYFEMTVESSFTLLWIKFSLVAVFFPMCILIGLVRINSVFDFIDSLWKEFGARRAD